MGKYLITGRAGSGKSAVTEELRARRLPAFDTDKVPGLSSWQDVTTGEKVRLASNSYVDLQKLQWIWDAQVLSRLLEEHADIFICGGADNDLSFNEEFDATFVLDVKPDVQIGRLSSRTNNSYGKDPRMFPVILKDQASHLTKALELGAIAINANTPIEAVVNEILSHTI